MSMNSVTEVAWDTRTEVQKGVLGSSIQESFIEVVVLMQLVLWYTIGPSMVTKQAR